MQDIKLPKNIPIFPLPGVLLLPGGILPLHIFEQRYLDMFRDVLASNGIIGMIQPELEQAHLNNPAVFSTGCAGKISHSEGLYNVYDSYASLERKKGFNIQGFDSSYSSKNIKKGDIIKIPFKEEEFDIVLCLDVLEHLSFEEQNIALKELNRILT